MSITPKFTTETQNFRFIPAVPINHDDAVSLASGTKAGDYVVVSHEQPRATYVIEPNGSILVHGLSRLEVAELAVRNAREVLQAAIKTNEWELDAMLEKLDEKEREKEECDVSMPTNGEQDEEL